MKPFAFNIVKKKQLTIIYITLMTLVYYAYVLIEQYHLSIGESMTLKGKLTMEEIDSLLKLGSYANTAELIFFWMFLIGFLLVHILSRKNINMLFAFLLVNAGLFLGIYVINYVIFMFTKMPIGNLMQPLYLSFSVFVALIIYVLILRVSCFRFIS